MLDPGLEGRVAIVTGANNPLGIGAATCRAFAREGASVLLHYKRVPAAPAAPDELVRSIRAAGGRVEVVESDLADPASAPDLFERAERALGPVEVLVHNATHWEADSFAPEDRAGALWPPRAERVGTETVDRHFAVIARAAALLIAEFALRHRARGARWGRVICLTTGGARGFPGEVSYGASKSALESYARAAAVELGPLGVTVNVVDPGATQTGWMSPELERRLTARLPHRRVGRPEDAADLILLLASEQARWVTGQVVHGGGEGLPRLAS
jgi:3-oxoacyl-[acyl-carrier protein] reductase